MKHAKFIVFLFVLTFSISCGQQKTYVQYQVKKGETMSSIARKLNIPTQDLLRLNPDVKTLKADTFIVVPQKNLESSEDKKPTTQTTVEKPKVKEVIKDDIVKEKIEALEVKNDTLEAFYKDYITYKVKKGDTFFSLSRSLNMSRYDLISLNPFLRVGGLKTDQILRIKKVETEKIDNEDVITVSNEFYQDKIKNSININAALLLPFNTGKYQLDSLSAKSIFTKNAMLVNIATDFYLGAQVAVDSLRTQGIDINLSVFDTGDRGTNKIPSLLATKKLNNFDVLIGPMFSEQVVEVSKKVNIPIVFPVYSKNQSDFSDSNIIKTATEKEEYRKLLQNYLIDNFVGGNIMIIADGSQQSTLDANALKSAIEFNGKIGSVSIIRGENGNISKASITSKLLPNKQNWVVLASEKNITVSSTINSLISLPENTTAKLFALEKTAVYDDLDNKKLAQLGFVYVSDSFKNTDINAVNSFEAMYFKNNHTVPSYYATKGFDITYDILMRLSSGNSLEKTFEKGKSYRAETFFNYNNNRVSENIGLFILGYKSDLTLERLK